MTDRGEGLYFDDRVGMTFYRSINRDGWLLGVDPELKGEEAKICQNLNPFMPSPLTGVANLNQPEDAITLTYVDHHKFKNANYVIVSEEIFDRISYQGGYTQISVMLSDYSYTDRVISQLGKLGYAAVSPYCISSVRIDYEKAEERMTTLVICMLALIVAVAAQVAVLTAMFGLEMKNYRQLSDLGLACRTGKVSILWQVLLLTAIGQLVTAGVIVYAVKNMADFASIVQDTVLNNPAISFAPDRLPGAAVGSEGPADMILSTVKGWVYDGIVKLHDIVKYLEPLHIALICAVHLGASLLVTLAASSSLRKQVFPYVRPNTDVDLIELETEEVAE